MYGFLIVYRYVHRDDKTSVSLKDFYSSLEELCSAFELESEEIIQKLNQIGYVYDVSLNKLE